MARITIQKPTDQPTGRSRLIAVLCAALSSSAYDQFLLMVAFARVGPLLRLFPEITAWRKAGKKIKAIFGIDEQGTTREALEFALDYFSESYVAHVPGPFSPIFHPKVYLFSGKERAIALIGSNNLTVGGSETNLETHLCIELDFPHDASLFADLRAAWQDGLAVCTRLTQPFLLELVQAGLVLTESLARRSRATAVAHPIGPSTGSAPSFPPLSLVPPSAIPPGVLPHRRRQPAGGKISSASAPTVPGPSVTQALVIQIVPHHNGEVFLSKTAVDQDPSFFGWPFTGQSTSTQSKNPAYPQRVPDPVVDLRVYDTTEREIVRHDPFNLNTVFYSTRSEIRITVPQDVVQAVPDFSILVMRQGTDRDYEMDIFVPGSPQYQLYFQSCNQRMPSGGAAQRRMFGWI